MADLDPHEPDPNMTTGTTAETDSVEDGLPAVGTLSAEHTPPVPPTPADSETDEDDDEDEEPEGDDAEPDTDDEDDEEDLHAAEAAKLGLRDPRELADQRFRVILLDSAGTKFTHNIGDLVVFMRHDLAAQTINLMVAEDIHASVETAIRAIKKSKKKKRLKVATLGKDGKRVGPYRVYHNVQLKEASTEKDNRAKGQTAVFRIELTYR